MTASGYNALLILLFSGTLIISAVVPCRGEAVVDIQGNEVGLGSSPGSFQYWIHFHDLDTGSHGFLAKVPANGSSCQNYIFLAPQERIQLMSTEYFSTMFLPTSSSNNPAVMQVDELYEYRSVQSDTGACNAPGVWTLGNLTGTDQLFRPIIAGQESGPYTRQSWFAVSSTGRRGQYYLAGCPCVACGIPCPDSGSYASSLQVDGRRVLGVGVRAAVIVQFARNYWPLSSSNL